MRVLKLDSKLIPLPTRTPVISSLSPRVGVARSTSGTNSTEERPGEDQAWTGGRKPPRRRKHRFGTSRTNESTRSTLGTPSLGSSPPTPKRFGPHPVSINRCGPSASFDKHYGLPRPGWGQRPVRGRAICARGIRPRGLGEGPGGPALYF